MKKTYLIAPLLFFISSMSYAQSSMTLSYANRTMDNNSSKVSVTGLSVRTKVADNLFADFGFNQSRAESSDSLTNRTEVGLSSSKKLNDTITASFRGGLGMKNSSGKQGVEYYSLEPAVGFKLPIDKVSARVAYRYRNAFDESKLDRSHTMRYSLNYDLTKKDRVSLGYEELRGDGANKQTVISYTRAF